MNPDSPQPNDPPIDNVSMLEVCNDARRSAIAARKHATKMMVPFALRALLDGYPPQKVAEACGFGQPDAPESDEDEDESSEYTSFTSYVMFGSRPAKPDPLAGFVRWLKDGVASLVKEAAS